MCHVRHLAVLPVCDSKATCVMHQVCEVAPASVRSHLDRAPASVRSHTDRGAMAKRTSAGHEQDGVSGKRQRQILFCPMVCPFCPAELTRAEYGKHVSRCGGAVYGDPEVESLSGCIGVSMDGKRVMHCVGGAQKEDVAAALALYKFLATSATELRPNHSGHIYGLGWCPRNSTFLKLDATPTRRQWAVNLANKLLDRMWGRAAMRPIPFRKWDPSLPRAKAPSQRIPITDVPGVACPGPTCFSSWGYSPREWANDKAHPPPWAVATKLGTKWHCEVHCETCRLHGCNRCPRCCMHFDANDKSLTMALFWQRAKTPVSEKAYFVIDSHAYSVARGSRGTLLLPPLPRFTLPLLALLPRLNPHP